MRIGAEVLVGRLDVLENCLEICHKQSNGAEIITRKVQVRPHDLSLCLVEVLALKIQWPIARRARDDVAQVSNLVRQLDQLDQLGCAAGSGRLTDLQSFARRLLEPFCVGDLRNDLCDLVAELPSELVIGGFRVLDCVVQ